MDQQDESPTVLGGLISIRFGLHGKGKLRAAGADGIIPGDLQISLLDVQQFF